LLWQEPSAEAVKGKAKGINTRSKRMRKNKKKIPN
jgi:hypothetical protein